MGVLEDSPQGIAEFIHNTSTLDWNSLRKFLQDRSECVSSNILTGGYYHILVFTVIIVGDLLWYTMIGIYCGILEFF